MKAIIYGPQGCGKTTNAKSLARHLGLTHIIDDGEHEDGRTWLPGYPIPEDTLVLTNCADFDVALDFFKIKAAMDMASVLGSQESSASSDKNPCVLHFSSGSTHLRIDISHQCHDFLSTKD